MRIPTVCNFIEIDLCDRARVAVYFVDDPGRATLRLDVEYSPEREPRQSAASGLKRFVLQPHHLDIGRLAIEKLQNETGLVAVFLFLPGMSFAQTYMC